MICRNKLDNDGRRFDDPSPERIRKLTAEIRKRWSPRMRDRRAADGRRRVEVKVVSLVDVRDESWLYDV